MWGYKKVYTIYKNVPSSFPFNLLKGINIQPTEVCNNNEMSTVIPVSSSIQMKTHILTLFEIKLAVEICVMINDINKTSRPS